MLLLAIHTTQCVCDVPCPGCSRNAVCAVRVGTGSGGVSLADELRRTKSQSLLSPSGEYVRRDGGAEVMTVRQGSGRPSTGMKAVIGV